MADHPHDGYAYDGCQCVCCTNVRALQWPPIGERVDPDLRTRIGALEAALGDGAIPAMRWAARRLSVLGEDAAEVAKLDSDADKLLASLDGAVATEAGETR